MGGRLPALSWSGGPQLDYASIWRSSQPADGILGKGCPEDEKFLNMIRNGSRNGKSRDFLVLDLRPRTAAWANKARGGGFEDYAGCAVVFGGIDNVHGVRDAWHAMGQAVLNVSEFEVGSWFKDVGNSGWFDIMGHILSCARQVVDELQQHRCNALIHCSDGWDRTAQVASLAMLCMDAHYRTVAGLLLLIQKEFCSFGHPFQTRLALNERPSSEYSPIFLQWLECVYQVMVQFPTAFEFTPDFLLRLGSEALTNRYGTFFKDCERAE